MPFETNVLKPSINRQESINTLQDFSIEAELQAGTAASRGEASEAHQADALGPNNAEEPEFDVFSLLQPPKVESAVEEEAEEFALPSTDTAGLPPIESHQHPNPFDAIAGSDPAFDEAEVDYGDEGIEPKVEVDDEIGGGGEQGEEGKETAPSAEASAASQSAAVDPQPKTTRGARGGQKHQFE